MSEIAAHIAAVRATLPPEVQLVCVSKYHPEVCIEEAYAAGERDFGESHVQEVVRKQAALPKDIRWHFIGHLQTNKVRALVSFVYLIQSVDSLHLLETIEREAARISRTVSVLLEVHVAREETKSGFTPAELEALLESGILTTLPHIYVRGIMGMATNTEDTTEIRRCFDTLHTLYAAHTEWTILSMGMSEDYPLAVEAGSTMVRVGSAIFGMRS